MVKGCLFLLILWGGSLCPLFGKSYTLPEVIDRPLDISSSLEMCRYKSAEEIPENPLKIDKTWERVRKSGVSLGYSSDTLVFRFSLDNPMQKIRNLLFELDYYSLDYVTLYTPLKEGGYGVHKIGDMVPFGKREIDDRLPVFKAAVMPGTSLWYLKIQSTGALRIRLKLYSMESYVADRAAVMPFLWMLLGMLVLLTVVNIIMYLSVREKSFLYYIVFMIVLCLEVFTTKGFSFQYLWPASTWWQQVSIPFFLNMATVTAALFIQSYMKTKENYSLIHDLLKFLNIVPGLILACLAFFAPLRFVVMGSLFLWLFFSIINIGTVIIGIMKKDRSAFFLLAGMMALFLALPLVVLGTFGVLPHNALTIWSSDISLSFFGLFLALGLGDRINTMKRSLEKSQRKINIQNEELQAANEELQAANEEFEVQNEELADVCSELEESEQKFRELSELLPQTIFEMNNIGVITYVNQYALNSMGYTGDDLERGVNALDLVISKDRERVIRRMTEMLHQDEVKPSEYTMVKKDGTHYPALIFTRPIMKNGELKGYRGMIADLTEQKKREAMMIQSEKMMTVGGLAAGMAHEINNPLGIILQGIQNTRRRFDPGRKKNLEYAEAMGLDLGVLKGYMDERDITAYLDGIEKAGNRASKIIRNMLAFSRKSSSNREAIDINELLDEVLGLAENDYDLKKKFDFKHIAIVRDYGDNLPPVPVIRTEIEQVFLNIIKNSAQALFEYFNGEEGPEIRIQTGITGAMAVVDISDNGPGMDEETRKRIFEPFFSTKDSEGTGLGLSVSYFIITGNHNGSISVESKLDRGTTFHLELPLEGKV